MPEHAYSAWRKSSRSGSTGGNCVEVGFADNGEMAGVRDTKEAANPNRSMLEFTTDQWGSFLDAIRSGRIQ